jgi:CBS domain containing-hemolysin-like protein
MSVADLLWVVPLMLLLLGLKGFFSGSEIAMVNADRIQLGHEAKQGSKGAQLVLETFRHPERVLTTTLIGTNVATVTLTTLGTLVMIRFLGEEAGDVYAFLIYTPIFLVLGEVVPKAIYQQQADRIAPIVVYPLRFFSRLLSPLVLLFSAVARFAARRVGAAEGSDRLLIARDQLRAVMEMADRGTGSAIFDRSRVERAIRFPGTTVGERMVPAGEMVAISRTAGMERAIELVRQTGHTTLPVYDERSTNVVGTLLLSPWRLLDPTTATRSPVDLMVQTVYVSPHQSVEEIVPLLRERTDEMAVVVDEFGSAMGLITMDDVYETVVGEVNVGRVVEEPTGRDHHETEALDGGGFRMDGHLSISEVNDLLGIDLPTREYHTIGGMVASRLRRLARGGDSVTALGYRFTVEEATDRTVKKVRVEPVPREDATGS